MADVFYRIGGQKYRSSGDPAKDYEKLLALNPDIEPERVLKGVSSYYKDFSLGPKESETDKVLRSMASGEKPIPEDIPVASPELKSQQKKIAEEAILRSGGDLPSRPIGSYIQEGVREVADQPFLRSFTKGATAGLSEPVAAGISSLILKGMGEEGPVFSAGAPSLSQLVTGEKPQSIYEKIREGQKSDLERLEKESPTQALLGSLTGIISPGGVYSQGTKALGAVAKAIPGATRAAQAIQGLQQAGLAKQALAIPLKAAQTGLTAGLTNIPFQAIESLSEGKDISPGEAFTQAAGPAAGVQALLSSLGVGGRAAAKGLKAIGKPVESLMEAALSRDVPLVSGIVKKLQQGRLGKVEKGLENIAERKGVENVLDVSGALKTATQKGKKALSKSYEDMVKPVLKKVGEKQVSPKGLRDEIGKVLSEEGFLKGGKVSVERLSRIPKGSPLRGYIDDLANMYKSLKGDIPVEEFNILKKSLQASGKFAKMQAKPGEAVYRQLSGKAREMMEKNIEELVPPEMAQAYKSGMKEYATKKPALDTLNKIFGPNRAIENAPGAIKRMGGSKISELMKTLPEASEPIRNVVIHDITRAKTPKALTKILDKYGRSSLKNILDEGTLKELEGMEKLSESVFMRALGRLGEMRAPKFQGKVSKKIGLDKLVPLPMALGTAMGNR